MSEAAQERVPALLVVAIRELVPERHDWLARLGAIVQAAADWPAGFVALQLRFDPPVHAEEAESLRACLEAHDPRGRVPVYWNRRARIASPHPAWHAHLPENQLNGAERPRSPWSASVHDGATLPRARGAFFVVHAPIFTPTWKPVASVGIDGLASFCRTARQPGNQMPVLALGGITPQRIAACRQAGAAGVAVASGILCAADVAQAVADHAEVLARSSG
jgi:thiamine-phosphate pyrophosphorylase